MPGRPVARRRRAQARRVRRLETERPHLSVVVRQGTAWAALNTSRLPGLVLALGCALLLIVLFSDPRFFIYEARVSGNHLLSREQLYAASGLDMLSIFFVAPRAVQERLLRAYPGLQEARVALMLPAQAHIQVVEKRVQFVWEVGGQAYLADDRGAVLGVGSVVADALVIRASDGPPPASGQVLDSAVLDTVVRLSQLLDGTRVFEYSSQYGVSWRAPEGWPVHFGVGGDLPAKVAVMRTLSAQLARSRARPQFLDVAVPGRPYYR